jgi:mono/diheme cytochrome c family protein
MTKPAAALGLGLLLLASHGALTSEPGAVAKKLPPAAPGTMDFRKDIEPIFQRACVSCHGAQKQHGGLRLDSGEAARKGSNSGPVLVPGKAASSRLLHVVAGLDPDTPMPPRGKAPLSAAEVGKLRAWIDQGAVWPERPTAGKPITSGHWAFQPIRRPEPPRVRQAGWVRNPIDAFILARLEKEGIAPSPQADRVTLLRRLKFDLLGLPPTPQEVEAFGKDSAPGAYERLVDRLLASPHYGERWGRHWLDVARYADSDGYEQDRPRPFAWRYRRWIIEALNRDLPFDRFAVEQLAGDLLPGATLDQKTATGFHRNTLTNREGGTDKEQFRVEASFDRVATTAKAFLGLTAGCAQCHDHKYDPLSQREFYQLFAFFNSDEEADLAAPLPGEEETHREARAAFERKRKELQDAIARRRQALESGQAKNDPQLAQLTKALAVHERAAPKLSVVATLALGKGRKTHVLLRGDFLRPGVEVQPGTPAVLHPLKTNGARPTRLDLANWIVDPANPLTPRVITNWVWQRYFGRGLVATPEDFGTQGERPSHPELLDFLATEFVRQGWGLKRLHRLIVTSAAYRQSSAYRPELATRDPANTLLARQNRLRLEAEILRDNALAVSGLLRHAVGGPSVRPPQPAGVSELTYANTAKWVVSKGADRYRRGLYTWFQRTSPYPMLTTFDAPDGVLCCVRREKSNTPLQALTLLNDAVFVECARALARRVAVEARGSSGQRLEYAFRLCLGRSPARQERAALTQLYADLVNLARSDPREADRLLGDSPPPGVDRAEAAAWVALGRALMNLDEFVTRE